MTNSKRKSSSGSVYSALDWLSNHYSIKSEGRFDLVGRLPIQPGDRIIDIGCANGAWTRIMAERVGINGEVWGVDLDPELIRHAAKTHQNNHLSQRISFKVLDIEVEAIPPDFNIITAFNTLSLVENPLIVLQKIHSYLKRTNGILIIKDSALSSDFFWPLEPKVQEAISQSLSSGGKINGYDPDFALTCRKYLKQCEFTIQETKLSSYAFMYPFGQEQRTYISQNAKMIQELKPASTGSDAIDTWITDEMSEEGSFFESSDSIYTTTEYTYICKPS